MKARQKDRGLPDPGAPWNEVAPGLWMGGHHWRDVSGVSRPAVVGSEFDLVISLFTRPGHGPDPAVEHHVADTPDGPLTAAQIHKVQDLALVAAQAVRDGRSVLVRCNAGYNRSGLVVGQALIELGQEAEAAIGVIRRKRSPWALNNPVFEQYLTTGLGVARLLADLDPLT
ncbi:protein-tyrosine phosphatase family protein [Streptomyces showdoensis]|uniref:Protein phosphatase n=1 Tax=Streptomyces showdoensis TaxID=68268 RepID=A0A2P2GU50_STREW|nr:dual specificity protein phosphatase family protein [Streptomyces showdoensis]KKZ75028.1 protein phosphatase [Streptomyces showdoensis]